MTSALVVAAAVGLGGGVGAALRYALDLISASNTRKRSSRTGSRRQRAPFPWTVVLINLSGSLVLGILGGIGLHETLSQAISVGVLGGYTTFSTASLDTLRLFRGGSPWLAMLHALGTFGGSVLLAGAGVSIGYAIAG